MKKIMVHPVHEVVATDVPSLLWEIPQPPKTLTYRGTLPPADLPLLTVVGTRKYSTYGKQAVDHLIDGLRDYRVGIVSGLALGIDSLAHEAAMRNNLYTLAIPGSGLDDDVLYPVRHRPLARRILESGGGLLSEFAPDFKATKWSFIQRNRLMAGIAAATLVIEATEQSGTLVTARMCADYNRDLLVVPGNIFSATSQGPHLFLKLGAIPITNASDIIEALHLQASASATPTTPPSDLTDDEKMILAQLREPAELATISQQAGVSVSDANIMLMQLELKGFVGNEHGVYRRLH